MGNHDGHRERVRERYLERGLDSLDDTTVIELLLFYSIPRVDTHDLAKELINSFGSLRAVFDASPAELQTIEGIGEKSAVLISLVKALTRRYAMSETAQLTKLESPLQCGSYFSARLRYECDEKCLLACLDLRKRIICCVEVSSGVVNSVHVDTRKIVETALRSRAVSVVLAHNHPEASSLPSRDDQQMTRRINAALELVGVKLDDHIVIGNDGFHSFATSGLL